jgi:predicted nucleic acid-binding protein
MEYVFIDTGAWDAIEDSADANHAAALRYKAELVQHRTHLCTTNFVLDETYTLLLLNLGHARTVTFKNTIDQLQAGGILTVVHVTEEIGQAAWAIFERFNHDKQWSFTDCTSRVVMERMGITRVFAFDHHFEQMGFIRLPIHGP